VVTVALTECPYHDADFAQEIFLYEQFNHYRNQMLALGGALIDYAQWIIDGMNICNRSQRAEEKRKVKG
jgi:hypothetical protein